MCGDTTVRSYETGEDEFFQLIFPKAKILSENTLTMEADGDPSVFNMNMRLLRPSDGVMAKLVKYDLVGGEAATVAQSTMIHNHWLNPKDENPEQAKPTVG